MRIPGLAALALALAPILPALAAPHREADPAQAAALIVEEANALRRERGLAPLAPDERLAAAARGFARYLATHEKLSHEADGRTPSQRAKSHGYDYCVVSENIGYQFRSRGFRTEELARGHVDGWKRSPAHRENLVDREVTQTGAAVARAKNGRYYAVQMFGRPAALAVEFSVANESQRRVRYRVGEKTFTLPPRTERTHSDCSGEPVQLEGKPVRPARGERFVIR